MGKPSSKMLGRASQAVVGGLEGAFQWYGKQVAAFWILLEMILKER